jgi:hypothetical protein
MATKKTTTKKTAKVNTTKANTTKAKAPKAKKGNPQKVEVAPAEAVKGGAKPRRVAGQSKSAVPLEELCETGRIWPMALGAVGQPGGLMEERECTRTWTSG